MISGPFVGTKEERAVSHVTGLSRRLLLALVLLSLFAATRSRTASGDPPSGATATCVFTNPAYSGACTQSTPIAPGSTAAQACESVLACLNNAQCEKTYCNATQVRGGWKLESAK
jgi:hypothetical protein